MSNDTKQFLHVMTIILCGVLIGMVIGYQITSYRIAKGTLDCKYIQDEMECWNPTTLKIPGE